MFSQNDKERVLRRLLELRNPKTGKILTPKSLLDSFTPLSPDDCSDILDSLEDDGLIHVETADYPESDGIWYIDLLPPSLIYFEIAATEKAEKRKMDWRWRITTAIAIAALIISLISLLKQ